MNSHKVNPLHLVGDYDPRLKEVDGDQLERGTTSRAT